ncbi:PRM1A protein, partial [Heliornis fulica]|nr:PRM1A protein [Heliornis fulica]
MELGNISQPVYGPGPEAPGSSMPGLVQMALGFLRLVQPNALPIGEWMVVGSGDAVGGLLLYLLGFLVCIAIGLLFIILMPLVGCCFCCCRC